MGIVCLLLRLYIYVLWARVILSFVFMFRPDFRPPEGVRPLLNGIYALTDPPVNYLRRFLPQPALPIDLAFLVWFLIVYVLLNLCVRIAIF
jgi:YggT family protein